MLIAIYHLINIKLIIGTTKNNAAVCKKNIVVASQLRMLLLNVKVM